MPRTPKSRPGCRRYGAVTDEVLKQAITMRQEGISERKVCLDLKIPRSTLQNKMKQAHINRPGRPTVLTHAEELAIVNHLIATSEWGFPFDCMDVCYTVKGFLDKQGKTEKRFANNLPSKEWFYSFLKRHHEKIAVRFCQNISRNRASVTADSISEYFENLQETLRDVPPQNIINYDETNLSDDPGKKRAVARRGAKYPERVMNSSKSSTSLMCAGTADGQLLSPYIVYKSEHLWDTWTERGPKGAFYNRSRSGWFDRNCFEDWFSKVALPYCRKTSGRCVLIGDNLSSHMSESIISQCQEHDIAFVCLPPNATHLCQPLDIAFFAPMKKAWRKILADYKNSRGNRAQTVQKDQFPSLLKVLFDSLQKNAKENLEAGFQKGGIFPCDKTPVLRRLPNSDFSQNEQKNLVNTVSDAFLHHLEQMRKGRGTGEAPPNRRKRKLDVVPGRSVEGVHYESDAEPSTSHEPSKEQNIANAPQLTEPSAASDASDSDDEWLPSVFTRTSRGYKLG